MMQNRADCFNCQCHKIHLGKTPNKIKNLQEKWHAVCYSYSVFLLQDALKALCSNAFFVHKGNNFSLYKVQTMIAGGKKLNSYQFWYSLCRLVCINEDIFRKYINSLLSVCHELHSNHALTVPKWY